MGYDPRQSHRYRSMRAALRAKAKAADERCWICGGSIDYDAPPMHPDSWQCDHVKPIATHPELALDPSNCRSAHASCNNSKGTGEVMGIGRRTPRLR